jgi:hypothetical protein
MSNASSCRKGSPIYKKLNGLETTQNCALGPDGRRKRKRLCWRGPAGIYCNVMTSEIMIIGTNKKVLPPRFIPISDVKTENLKV